MVYFTYMNGLLLMFSCRKNKKSSKWMLRIPSEKGRIRELLEPTGRVLYASICQMGVSKNKGTPKWMVYDGKPYWNGWFGGKPTIFGNIHMPNLAKLGVSAFCKASCHWHHWLTLYPGTHTSSTRNKTVGGWTTKYVNLCASQIGWLSPGVKTYNIFKTT